MEQKKRSDLPVRALVEFVLRSGDIDNRRSGAAQKDAMAAGTRIHKKIQKRMGGNYRAEVPLKYAAWTRRTSNFWWRAGPTGSLKRTAS